jgi:hypothetical protein
MVILACGAAALEIELAKDAISKPAKTLRMSGVPP